MGHKRTSKKAKKTKTRLFRKLRRSLHVLWNHGKIRRLFKEDPYIKGAGWASSFSDDRWHVPLNILHVIFTLLFAPIFTILRLTVVRKAFTFKTKRIEEEICTPDAMLFNSPDGGPGTFDKVEHDPHWVLEVEFKGSQFSHKQVKFNSEIREKGYKAISYAFSSTQQLFADAERKAGNTCSYSEGQKISRRERMTISLCVLEEYARCRNLEAEAGDYTDGIEYIWLDEWCLSVDGLTDEEEIEKSRQVELGRLADIFKHAQTVIVYCYKLDCKHTNSKDCVWATRIFTIAEIFHARNVVTMTRCGDPKSKNHLITWAEGKFQRQMQYKAAESSLYHLSYILQHSPNTGANSWQNIIQALVVEAIRRDEATNFETHSMLGKALNGLLPRRALPAHLQGKDGWADLTWLLEINQGFYNAASLAAVCNVNLTPTSSTKEYRWWGKPLAPVVGTERLEPCTTAFPVKIKRKLPPGDVHERILEDQLEPVLSILTPKSVRIHDTVHRDKDGLYRHEDMVGLKNCMYVIATIMVYVGIPLVVVGATFKFGSTVEPVEDNPEPTSDQSIFEQVVKFITPGVLLLYAAFVIVMVVELWASTIYVIREGWIFLSDEEWGEDPTEALAIQDPGFIKLKKWGERQLIPKWEKPGDIRKNSDQTASHRLICGSLLDMKTRIYTKVVIIDGAIPDLMVLLAIHGTGVTGILLKSPHGLDVLKEDEEAEEKKRKANSPKERHALNSSSLSATRDTDEEDFHIYFKVGMANVPTYVLSKSEHVGTIFVGGELPEVVVDEEEEEEEEEAGASSGSNLPSKLAVESQKTVEDSGVGGHPKLPSSVSGFSGYETGANATPIGSTDLLPLYIGQYQTASHSSNQIRMGNEGSRNNLLLHSPKSNSITKSESSWISKFWHPKRKPSGPREFSTMAGPRRRIAPVNFVVQPFELRDLEEGRFHNAAEFSTETLVYQGTSKSGLNY